MYTKHKNIINYELVEQNLQPYINTKKKASRASISSYLPLLLKVGEITDENINKYLYNLKLADTTKKTIKLMWCSYINWLTRVYRIPFDTKQINDYTYAPRLKSFYTTEQKNQIFEYLEKFNNKKFELYFNIIAFNGNRLSETLEIDLEELYEKKETQITAKKGGLKRMIFSNDKIHDLLKEVTWEHWQKQSLSNAFIQFKKFVKRINPDWTLDIKASQMRTQLINEFTHKGISSSEIRLITGHANTATIEACYIQKDKHTMNKIFKRGKMPEIDALNVKQMKTTIDNLYDVNDALNRELEASRAKESQAQIVGMKKYAKLLSKITDGKFNKILATALNEFTKETKKQLVIADDKSAENSKVEQPWVN